MDPDVRLMAPYLLRVVRIGLQATWLALAALAAYPFVPGGVVDDPAVYWGVVAAAAAGGLIVWSLPWERLFHAGTGVWLLYAWSMADIMLISALVTVTGGDQSAIPVLYALTTLFFAIAYPQRGRLPLLLFTLGAFVGAVALTDAAISLSDMMLRVAIIGVVAFMSNFLSNEMLREAHARAAASRESERRAELLEAVARAARSMSSLDSDRVLAEVVDATAVLGFEAANLCVLSDDGSTYTVAHGRGLPDTYTSREHPSTIGMVSLVRESSATVTVNAYAEHERAVPLLRASGFRSVIATPVWVRSRLAAVLVAGTHDDRPITPLDAEVVELLAAQASRALENAHRFEEERRTVARLEELDRLKQEFIDLVSHELRTPLTAIQGMGLTLDRRWDDLDETTRREFLERLNLNAGTLQEIITTLLDFSRLDELERGMHVQRVRLDDLLVGVGDRLTHLFAGGALVVDVQPGLTVGGDPMLLERVVENLVSNAAKHTPEGTRVKVTARRDADGIEIAVEDDGPGIRPEDLPHLGERFFRGGHPNERPTRGTGLGLALVKKVLGMHETELRIHSRLGSGARFSFHLPVHEEAVGAAEVKAS